MSERYKKRRKKITPRPCPFVYLFGFCPRWRTDEVQTEMTQRWSAGPAANMNAVVENCCWNFFFYWSLFKKIHSRLVFCNLRRLINLNVPRFRSAGCSWKVKYIFLFFFLDFCLLNNLTFSDDVRMFCMQTVCKCNDTHESFVCFVFFYCKAWENIQHFFCCNLQQKGAITEFLKSLIGSLEAVADFCPSIF